MGFPVKQENQFPSLIQLRNESRFNGNEFYAPGDNGGVTPNNSRYNFYYVSPTVTVGSANKYHLIGRVGSMGYGRSHIVERIRVMTQSDCVIWAIRKVTGGSLMSNVFGNIYYETIGKYYQTNTSGGCCTFEFKDPLILSGLESVEVYYYKNSDTSVPCDFSVEGLDLTSDFNFNAKDVVYFLGDSITGITNEATVNNVNDSLWTFGLMKKLRLDGIDCRQINKAIGGSKTAEWAYMCDNGYFNCQKPSMVVMNVGANDYTVQANLSQNVGVDGAFKTRFKQIINVMMSYNPKVSIVVNNITPNQTTGGTLSSGIYSGMTSINAYRSEQLQCVNELHATGLDIVLADMSNLWNPTDTTYYLPSDTVHPNNSKGQPAMRDAIYEATKLTNFWKNNHTS